ncbi:MAG: MBL fold metallo-hydrolase [Candidatus Bathyarchaeia archaeon]
MVEVKVLRTGWFKFLKGGDGCEAMCTVSLLSDGGKYILVDTGGPGEGCEIVRLLEGEELAPEDIDYVVITHYHPDHVGNMCLFSGATFVDGVESFKGSSYTFYSGEFLLTDKVKIIPTPGHCSNDDCSVIVDGEAGVVAIVGDLFWSNQRDEPPFIFDHASLRKKREEIIQVADFIIPGHGGMFKVDKNRHKR